jgi:hypothetical protein
MALLGPSGSGKTYSALRIGRHLIGEEGRIAVIDTERGSAAKYGDLTEFDSVALESYEVENFINGIKAAEEGGYNLLIIDSLSHAWTGKGGVLEFVDAAKRRNKNDFGAWREATPLHNTLVESILGSSIHVIVTMRTKMAYVIETDEKGKSAPRKIGLQPVQRDGLEYEFDVIGDLDQSNYLTISKTRCSPLANKSYLRPGEEVAAILREWVGTSPPPKAEEEETDLEFISHDINKVLDVIPGEVIKEPEPDFKEADPTAPRLTSSDRKKWYERMITLADGNAPIVNEAIKLAGAKNLKEVTPEIMADVESGIAAAVELGR